MLLLKNTIETHQKLLALMVDRITPQITVALLDVFAREKILQDKSKCYNSLKTGHSVKIAHLNIVVLLVKGNITFLFVNLKLIRLRKITQVKTRHLKMNL